MKTYKAFFKFCNMQDLPKNLIIAIDGFSSSGKSTIAKDLSQYLKYKYLDTGAMYRAITYKIIKTNTDIKDIEAIKNLLDTTIVDFSNTDGTNQIQLDGEIVENKIRKLDVANMVSEVSTIPLVREYLVSIQQKIGEKGGIVMDGRDIGTVVFPNADFKFFVSASIETRANRRYKELLEKGNANVTLEEVKQNLSKRDKIDSERAHSPLKIAKDAIQINTEELTKKEQLEFVIDKIKSKISS